MQGFVEAQQLYFTLYVADICFALYVPDDLCVNNNQQQSYIEQTQVAVFFHIPRLVQAED
jgi:hypothetical protein